MLSLDTIYISPSFCSFLLFIHRLVLIYLISYLTILNYLILFPYYLFQLNFLGLNFTPTISFVSMVLLSNVDILSAQAVGGGGGGWLVDFWWLKLTYLPYLQFTLPVNYSDFIPDPQHRTENDAITVISAYSAQWNEAGIIYRIL